MRRQLLGVKSSIGIRLTASKEQGFGFGHGSGDKGKEKCGKSPRSGIAAHKIITN